MVKSSEEDLEIEEEDLKDLYAADYEDAEEGIDLDGYSEEDLESWIDERRDAEAQSVYK